VKGITKVGWPVVLLALVLVSPAVQAAAKPASNYAAGPAGLRYGHYHFGFEGSTKPWASLADGAPGYSLTVVSGDNGCPDMFGGLVNNHYVRLSSGPTTLDNHPPIPATWMVAGLRAGFGEYFVRVQWSARLDTGKSPTTDDAALSCQTCYPMAFVGAGSPQEGSQLRIADSKNPLDKSWRSYQYTGVVESSGKGFVFVALGWNGTNMSIGMDCVDVTITPILPPGNDN
jgi:hypothetical protein